MTEEESIVFGVNKSLLGVSSEESISCEHPSQTGICLECYRQVEVDRARSSARREALEEAARFCEEMEKPWMAMKIRSLASKEGKGE